MQELKLGFLHLESDEEWRSRIAQAMMLRVCFLVVFLARWVAGRDQPVSNKRGPCSKVAAPRIPVRVVDGNNKVIGHGNWSFAFGCLLDVAF